MTEEQSSLRRVATAVAAGSPPAGIFALVSLDAGHLLGADCAAIVRFQDADRVTSSGAGPTTSTAPKTRTPPSTCARAACSTACAAARPSRATGWTASTTACASPPRCAHGAAVWGALVVVATDPHEFAPGAEERLQDYADLIATAVANAEDRARLDAEAATDALTGLPNHRAFRERLAEEVARAQRHDRPLTVALVDVDGFRDLNDRAGLDAADEVLVEIGSLLRGAMREEDVLARMGADEYGVIFVESDRHQALHARRPRAARRSPRRRCATGCARRSRSGSATSRPRARPTRRCGAPTPRCSGPSSTGATCAGSTTRRSCASSTSASARASSIAPRRSSGLRALARAIDAKDPATQEHSERVAALSARLAVARGWAPERVALLRDAALLHDVGKIGVPDAILLKDGPLDDEEFAIVREHAVLGARIVGDVLDEEQIAWIAGHHERPDGSGYPGALEGDAVPEGAVAAGARRRLGRDGVRSLLQRADDARRRAGRGPRARRDAVRRRRRRGAREPRRSAATSCPRRRGCTSPPP